MVCSASRAHCGVGRGRGGVCARVCVCVCVRGEASRACGLCSWACAIQLCGCLREACAPARLSATRCGCGCGSSTRREQCKHQPPCPARTPTAGARAHHTHRCRRVLEHSALWPGPWLVAHTGTVPHPVQAAVVGAGGGVGKRGRHDQHDQHECGGGGAGRWRRHGGG